MDGIETTAPHHQLLHLVEAAQQAGYSEREIVEIVERRARDRRRRSIAPLSTRRRPRRTR